MLVGSAEHHEGPDGSGWKAPAREGTVHFGRGGNGESFGGGRESLDGINERNSFTAVPYGVVQRSVSLRTRSIWAKV